MPRGNQTGPVGAGPMSGCGAGFCIGQQTAGFQNAGGSFGRGCGRGFGFRNRFAQPVQPAQSAELSELKEKMDWIEKRLGELQG